MFFSSEKRKKKQLQEALAAGQEALADKRPSVARQHAEVARALAAEFARFEPQGVDQAAFLSHGAAAAQDDWAGAQAAHEWRVKTLEDALGTHTVPAYAARLDLVDVLSWREDYDAAERVLQRCKVLMPPDTPANGIIECSLMNIWVKQGKFDAAVAEARKLHEQHRNGPSLLPATQLAWTLAMAEQNLDEALVLAQGAMPSWLPRMPESHEGFLLAARNLALVYSRRGNFHELSHFCETVILATSEVGRSTISDEIACLHCEGLLELGMKPQALELARRTVRLLELRVGQRHPTLVAPLENLQRTSQRCGETRDAESAERRVLAIRKLVSGKVPAPRPPRPPRALVVWPRRTLAGIFHLRGVTPEMVDALLNHLRQAYRGPVFGGVFVLVSPESREAMLVLGNHADPWTPQLSIAARVFQVESERALGLLNAGRDASQAARVEPWWAVQDTLQVTWGEWPDGVKVRLEREDFPHLPGWLGDVAEPRWLGTGATLEDGKLRQVSPRVSWKYLHHHGIALDAVGPAAVLDGWFLALARVTGMFRVEAYDPLVPRTPSSSTMVQ